MNTETSSKTSRNRHVLIVDDEPAFTENMVRKLTEIPELQVSVLEDGFSLAAFLNENIPDIIFLDIVLPGVDGYSICRVLRRNLRTATVPIVLISGKVGDELDDRYAAAGATDWLAKPFTLEKFLAKLEQHTEIIQNVQVDQDDSFITEFNNALNELTTHEHGKGIPDHNNILSLDDVESLLADLDPLSLDSLREFSRPTSRPRLRLRVDPDRMKAVVLLHPPSPGGDFPDLSDVLQHIQGQGICAGIQQNEIVEGLQRLFLDRVPVEVEAARGRPPVHGHDTLVKITLSGTESSRVREDGSVDHKAHEVLLQARTGDLVGEVVPHQAGVDGHDIFGMVLKSNPGKEVSVKFGQGIRREELQLYAVRDGYLIHRAGVYDIQDGYVVAGDVGIETGNVRYLGNMVVKGTIRRGYRVECGGDLKVEGGVEGADLIVGGNLSIRGGVSGGERIASIHCQGRLVARHLENSRVFAGEDVVINDAVLHCRIYCGGHFTAQTGRGRILGGMISARNGILALEVGALGETRTDLSVGEEPKDRQRLDDLEEIMAGLAQRLKTVEEVVRGMKQRGVTPEILHLMQQNPNIRDFMANYRQTREQFSVLARERSERMKRVIVSTASRICIRGVVHPNVRITVAGLGQRLNETMNNVVFRLDDQGTVQVIQQQDELMSGVVQ